MNRINRFSILAVLFSFLTALAVAAPNAPTSLAASAVKATSFTVRWKAATGGTGGIVSYSIFRDGVLAGTSTAHTYGVTGLAPTTTYLMTVVATDGTGATSPASEALAVTTDDDTTRPSSPADLIVSAITTSSCRLTWTASTDNVGVAGYNVYRSGVLLGSTASTGFEVTGLNPDTNNHLTVRATDAAANLSVAAALVVRTLADPPSIPTGLSTTNLRPTSFRLRWTASTGGTGGIAAYDVYLNNELVGSPTTRSLALTGLAPTATYTLTVVSRDTAGRVSVPSEPLTVTTPADTARPTAPTGLSAGDVTSTSFTLTWTPSKDNVGVIGYDVYRNAVLVGSTPTPTFIVTELAPSTLSSMRVKARDAAGNISGFSAILTVTTSAPPNVPPTVALTAPANGAAFTLPLTLTLTAVAADDDGAIAQVEFFDGVTSLGLGTADLAQPGTWRLDVTFSPSVLQSSSHFLVARATDNQNATTDSAPVTITLNNPNESPTVSLTASAAGTAPAFLTLTAEATDSDGTIARVEFYEGSTLLGEVLAEPEAPATFRFPLTLYSAGTFSLTAVATDNSGAQSTSSVLVIAVNSGPSALPFVANFETAEGYVAGPLDKQLSWFATGGVSITPGAIPTPGRQQELTIQGMQPAQLVSHDFIAEGISPVFVDFRAQPVAGANPDTAVMFSTPAAQVALVGTASPAELWIFGGAGQGWHSTSQTVALDASGRTTDWIRLTTREDYAAKKWDLYLNGEMIAANTAFADGGATSLTDFSLNGHATVAATFDEFYAGAENPLFADINHNGIDDAWETAHGLSLTAENRSDDHDGDGRTNLQEYRNGTNPEDFFDGVAPVLTIVSGNDQTAVPGQFNAQPFVIKVTDAAGVPLANAPVTFTVATGDGLLAASTTDISVTTLVLHTAADGTARAYYRQPSTSNTTSLIAVLARSATITFLTQTPTASNPPQNGGSDTTDSGANGLPDAWEIKYFGHTGIDPGADLDGDGLTNAQEFAAETDPTDNSNANGNDLIITLAIDSNNHLLADGTMRVRITHSSSGKPAPYAVVTFATVTPENGIINGSDTCSLIVVRTDANGFAQVVLTPSSNVEPPPSY